MEDQQGYNTTVGNHNGHHRYYHHHPPMPPAAAVPPGFYPPGNGYNIGSSAIPNGYQQIVIKEPRPAEAKKAKRKRITQEQLKELTAVFEKTDTPSHDIRERLSKKLGMTNREVQVWFQNRRAKYNRMKNEKQRQIHTTAAAFAYPTGVLTRGGGGGGEGVPPPTYSSSPPQHFPYSQMLSPSSQQPNCNANSIGAPPPPGAQVQPPLSNSAARYISSYPSAAYPQTAPPITHRNNHYYPPTALNAGNMTEQTVASDHQSLLPTSTMDVNYRTGQVSRRNTVSSYQSADTATTDDQPIFYAVDPNGSRYAQQPQQKQQKQQANHSQSGTVRARYISEIPDTSSGSRRKSRVALPLPPLSPNDTHSPILPRYHDRTENVTLPSIKSLLAGVSLHDNTSGNMCGLLSSKKPSMPLAAGRRNRTDSNGSEDSDYALHPLYTSTGPPRLGDAKMGMDMLAAAAVSVSSAKNCNSLPHLTPLSEFSARDVSQRTSLKGPYRRTPSHENRSSRQASSRKRPS